MTDNIVKREIRFAIHLPKTDYREDCHYIKEVIHYADNTTKPNSYIVKNYKRPIWVTKQAFRNHKEKKEFELLERLNQQESTNSDLNLTVANLLGNPSLANNRNEIKNSPYVYGYDLTSTALIKLKSLSKNNGVQSKYSVAFYDIETNPDTQEIQLITVTFGNIAHTSILSKLVHNIPNVEYRLNEAIKKYLPDYTNLLSTIKVCRTEVDLIADSFNKCNELKPDLLAIWNMNFDIPKILERLKHHNVNPVTVLCDKNIPREYRSCRYKQGITKKVTASGVVKPISPSLQWHSLLLTAPFYVIDAMCVYRQLRIAKQEEQSYSLNSILNKELKKSKLSFKEADNYKGINWHFFMQENYPIEYIVYNIYDCLGMAELENKTKDLTSSFPAFAGVTDFSKFNSNPKKIVDALFSFGLERGKVIGTVPNISRTEEELPDVELDEILDSVPDLDELDVSNYKTLDLKNWIQLLRQGNLVQDGLKCLEEYPNVKTNIRGVVVDQDSVSSYPTCTLISNASKETCINELISVEGITEEAFREQNLSICLGNSNLLEYFNVMFNLPAMDEIDRYLDNINN